MTLENQNTKLCWLLERGLNFMPKLVLAFVLCSHAFFHCVVLAEQDTLYPLFFFQFLEDCWHQEHFKRPSAVSLYKTVVRLSGSFSTASKKEEPINQELQGVLLDSYILHQSHRISACETVVSKDSYTACLALCAPDDFSTTIALVKYKEDPKTELQAEVFCQ